MMNTKIILIVMVTTLFFTGCSNKYIRIGQQEDSTTTIKNTQYHFQEEKQQIHHNKFKLKPIVGTRNEDAKTVVDMGTVLKIWIAPYKSRNGVLTAMHDIYIWGKRPDFLVGEKLPGFTKRNDLKDIKNNKLFPISSSNSFSLLRSHKETYKNKKTKDPYQNYNNWIDKKIKKFVIEGKK